MWDEQAGAALAEATRHVLETMCFVAADEVPDPLLPAAAPIAAQVEFRGYWTGRCMVSVPENCARMIAMNFTGAPDAVSVEVVVMVELLCELANIVCGGTITRLECPGIVTLAPPHLIWEWPASKQLIGNTAVERWLDTGDGLMRVGFEAEAAS